MGKSKQLGEVPPEHALEQREAQLNDKLQALNEEFNDLRAEQEEVVAQRVAQEEQEAAEEEQKAADAYFKECAKLNDKGEQLERLLEQAYPLCQELRKEMRVDIKYRRYARDVYMAISRWFKNK